MGKPNPRKLEAKRRQAKARIKQQRRLRQSRPQPYRGSKFLSEEHLEPLMAAETGILQAYGVSGRALTDGHVRRALEGLLVQLRRDALPPPSNVIEFEEGDWEDLISQSVRNSWGHLQEHAVATSRDELVGVLRTVLGSIDVWSTPSRESRGYLAYLEGFLKKLGLSCATIPLDAADEADEDPDLLAIGRAWCAGQREAGPVFKALAEQMIADAEGEQVAEVCQKLIGEGTSTEIFCELSLIAINAQKRAGRLKTLG